MSCTLVIPPVHAPGAEPGSGRMEVCLELVDGAGQPIPTADPGNTFVAHGLGQHVVTDTEVQLVLSTQSELADETFYRVMVRHGRSQFVRDVQIPSRASTLTWAQFLNLQDPVVGGLAWADRLLPPGETTGQVPVYDASTGLYVAGPAAGAGILLTSTGGIAYEICVDDDGVLFALFAGPLAI